MSRLYRKYLLFILLILLVPTILFSVYEIGSLRKNEQIIERIYTNQLDAILFSINQYSEDMVSSWARRLGACFNSEGRIERDKMNELLQVTPAIDGLYTYKLNTGKISTIQASTSGLSAEQVVDFLHTNDSSIAFLKTYLRGGYRKIESGIETTTNKQLLFFAQQFESHTAIIVVQVDPNRFITEVLDPKIQEVAQEEFQIAAFRASDNQMIYTSDLQRNSEFGNLHRQPIWLLPAYTLGIELRDTTITTLARDRSRRNLGAVILLDFFLLLGFILILRNIKKQIELSQLKTDFVANVSHEIRTPLALITMYIETLEMGRVKTEDKIKEYYGIILQEVNRLSGIVNKILNFSQIESGKRKFTMLPCNVNELIEKAYDTFLISLKKQDFEHSLKLHNDLPRIQADGEALTDAIMNLIDNAIKYSSEEKYLEIASSQINKNTVAIEITDRGVGISHQEQKHVFNKFYRVMEKDLATPTKGSGIGLTLVKQIMDAHGGKIEIQSKKGRGSTFRLLFPII